MHNPLVLLESVCLESRVFLCGVDGGCSGIGAVEIELLVKNSAKRRGTRLSGEQEVRLTEYHFSKL
ncbi:unnamed protein product [Toxocara canis]|uniref:Uncharacterized protein n=1 Tax=Toxocara canis TaxID=6265 RepID=A0A3P7IJ55_TOXCA|nr:unnamed protein product [Toxocara canis]